MLLRLPQNYMKLLKYQMKKLYLIFTILIGLSVLSCSSEDENKISQDLIIGKWKPRKFIEVFSDAGEIKQELSDCYQQGEISFYSNSDFSRQYYYDYVNGECVGTNESNRVSGTWKKVGPNQFHISLYYAEENMHDLIGEMDFITFTDSNTMRMIFFEGYEVDGDFLRFVCYEYSRIE